MSFDGGLLGSFVISKNGHDKGEIYIITAVVDDSGCAIIPQPDISKSGCFTDFRYRFVLVANGENRPLKKPKRKNIRHLFVTKYRTAATSDLQVKRDISLFKRRNSLSSEGASPPSGDGVV